METKRFKVADTVFSVSLEEPFRFMRYTPAVLERIAVAAKGGAPDVLPTRAGDDVPPRTLIRSREELSGDRTKYDLNFSQYEPFAYDGPRSDDFSLKVCAQEPEWLAAQMADGTIRLIMSVDERPPIYYIYDRDGDTFYTFDADEGHIAGTLFISADGSRGEYYPKPGMSASTTNFQLSTALMMFFTHSASRKGSLLMHASVIRHNGKANLFFGTSGTGKSTHSRLWLGSIEGCDLVNDDNPVLSAEEDGIFVYGTPWSGKTPCYRNLRVPVRALVRLEQAPENVIRRISGLSAYGSVIASASSIRWKRDVMDRISAAAEAISMGTTCWELKCLPDSAAAILCQKTIERE